MRVPRIYLDASLQTGQRIPLTDHAFRHVVTVLRLKTGAELLLFNGEGGQYQATIASLSRRECLVDIGAFESIERESPVHIHLGQGVSKGERMDFVMQKSVELGVAAITPIKTERTVVNLKAERRTKRLAHWQQVVVAACEQSGRNQLPDLANVHRLADWLVQVTDYPQKILLAHDAETSIAELKVEQNVAVLIGPEGGLSPDEKELAESHGFTPIRMGPRIMRTETACLAALAVIQAHSGGF
jgi:16S rRNA (uracil1498-N3)-methyltransferase